MASGGGGGGNSTDRHKLGDKVYSRKSFKGLKTSNTPVENSQTLTSQELNFAQDRPISRFDGIPADFSSLNRFQGANLGQGDALSGSENAGAGSLRTDNLISISTACKSKKERRDLRRKLESELNLVRNWVKKIEQNLNFPVTEGVHSGKLKQVHSEVGSVGGAESRPLEPLSLPVMENILGASDNLDKEKRTPKANQFYQNSEFVLGKERIPSSDQNKKSKVKGKRGGGELGSGFEMGNPSSKIFKSCSSLLDKLMKHKHGWIFSSPVDVEGLGLHDYFLIIKHPMDLGTIKSRLNSNHYQTPGEFAEDVRLTFHNALTYNPEGHDVNAMARKLLKIFEDRWVAIEADLRELRVPADYDAGLPTPTSKMALPPPTSPPRPPPPPSPPLPPSADSMKTLDGSGSMTNPGGSKAKLSNNPASGRIPRAKKPRAKDPNKRDMTFEEKQKLSTSLQNLPSEKLDNVVQIIKKRNPSLCQNDDEIEVDIDSFDTETLWELDRFVVNYKKNLSKIKRRAELDKAKMGAEPILLEKSEAPSLPKEPKENRIVEKSTYSSSPVQKQKVGQNISNGSSSSTTGSGSSSSGSDSDSSLS